MELKVSHKSICINEVVFDNVLEQPVELDYLLPDYCPSIFKMLKCKVRPIVTSKQVTNDKLIIDGIVYIRMVYVSEGSHAIRSLTQKQVFTKSVDLKEEYCNCYITAYPKVDYVNCRVVNDHRLDIRGAISIKTTIATPKTIDVVTNVDGMGVQINTQTIQALGERLVGEKEFSLSEQLELAYGKPEISQILDHSTAIAIVEQKIIQNKVIIKGEALIHTIYSCEEEKAHIMDYTVPFSQIVDIEGVSEDYIVITTSQVSNIEIEPNQANDGVEIELSLYLNCEANINQDTLLADDLYSTTHDAQSVTNKIKLEQLIAPINDCTVCKTNIKIPQNEISCVYDIVCEFINQTSKTTDGCINISGNLSISILALDCDNMPIVVDKLNPCEYRIDCSCCTDESFVYPHITISNVSYNMLTGDELEVRVELKTCGNLYKHSYYTVISGVNIDDECKKKCTDNEAVRLYYAENGERLWDIAKKFNTCCRSITEENCLTDDCVTTKGMLLIPIVE